MVAQEKFLTSFRIRLILLTAIGLIIGWIIGQFCPDSNLKLSVNIFFVGVLSNFIQFGLLPSLLSLSYGRKKQAFILSIIPLILSVPGAFVGVLSGFAVAFLTSVFQIILFIMIRPVLGFVFGMSLADQILSVYDSSMTTIASALAMLSGSAIVVGLTCIVQRHFLKNTTYLPSTKLIFKGTILSVLLVCLFLEPWAWKTTPWALYETELRAPLFGLPKNLAISLSVLPLFLLWIIRGEEAKTPDFPDSPRPNLENT
jgi:hypothetical protein